MTRSQVKTLLTGLASLPMSDRTVLSAASDKIGATNEIAKPK